jgi:vesicle-fusing ATPase
LVIGITNRKDLIDEALIRPGRLDVHIEIHIPDEEGRLEILYIHTELMQKNHFLDSSVDLKEIARLANNYTGAELEGVVKSAQSFALERWKRYQDAEGSLEQCKIIQQDFYKGL